MIEEKKFVVAEVAPGKKLLGRYADADGAKKAATRRAESHEGTRVVAGEITGRSEKTGRLECKIILRAGHGVSDGVAFAETS